jgi:hypothetical protein
MTDKKTKAKTDLGIGGCVGVAAWLTVVLIVHNQLWSGYDPAPEDWLGFFVVDAIAATVAVGAVAAPLALLWWLWKKLTRQ